jgi:nucleoid DNA-binding protein
VANFKDQNTQEAIDLFLGNIEDILEDNEQVSLSLFNSFLSLMLSL